MTRLSRRASTFVLVPALLPLLVAPASAEPRRYRALTKAEALQNEIALKRQLLARFDSPADAPLLTLTVAELQARLADLSPQERAETACVLDDRPSVRFVPCEVEGAKPLVVREARRGPQPRGGQTR